MEIISMTCRNCGGKLSIFKDAEQCICQHCGTEFVVFYNEGSISLKILSQGLQKIQASTDKTASELALRRLREEKESIRKSIINEIVKPLEQYYLVNYKPDEIKPGKVYDFVIQVFQEEQKKLFKNQGKLILLDRLSKLSKEYLDKWNEIEKQENYHLRVLSGQ